MSSAGSLHTLEKEEYYYYELIVTRQFKFDSLVKLGSIIIGHKICDQIFMLSNNHNNDIYFSKYWQCSVCQLYINTLLISLLSRKSNQY